MIGASDALRVNQPELRIASSRMADAASTSPPSSQPQCMARAPRSDIAGQCGIANMSARTSQIRYGSTSTTITSSAYNGSSDVSTRRPRSVATANPASSNNNKGAAEIVSSNSPASIDQANHALR